MSDKFILYEGDEKDMSFEEMLKKIKMGERITNDDWEDEEFIYLDTIIVNEDSPIEDKILVIYRYNHKLASTKIFNFTMEDLFNNNWRTYNL